jgi:transposase
VVAKAYRPVVRDQVFLLPPDMREWLPDDHPVWLVIEAVGQLDTSAFHARRRLGGAGAAAYDPDMMITLLVWAYANQVTSSRRIERLCGQDVAFRVICGGNLPDHVTVARFRQQFADAAAGLFTQVLVLCARLGMGRLGVVALDGTKIRANAAVDANRGEEKLAELAAAAVAAHAAADAQEDALFPAGPGDQAPPDARTPHTRAGRIAAALASARAERERRDAEAAAGQRARQDKAAEYVTAARAGTPKRGPSPHAAAAGLARLAVDREIAAYQAKVAARDAAIAAGRAVPGRPPVPAEQYCRVRAARAKLDAALARDDARDDARDGHGAGGQPARPAARGAKIRRNITDPDSRLLPVRGGGYIQGYNAQNVFSQDLLVIATELTDEPVDTPWYEPMMTAAQDAAALITAHQPPGPGPGAGAGAVAGIGLAVADAGYLSEHNLTCPGPDRLIATGRRHDLEKTARTAAAGGTPPGQDPAPGTSPVIAAMTARLATEDGITAYRHRSHIGETPHGNIKHNLRFRQLTMRGKPRAAGEWTFICTVHNLLTAIHSGHLTTWALATLQPS